MKAQSGIEYLVTYGWMIIAIGVIGGGLLLAIFADFGGGNVDNPAQTEGDGVAYASSSNDTVRLSDDEASKVFVVEDYGVEPYRINIELGESVAFENNRDDRVEISFDRSSNQFVMEPGERISLRVTGTTYASLEASNGWTGDAQIYVE